MNSCRVMGGRSGCGVGGEDISDGVSGMWGV